ncbi:MAG: molybdenum cofactor guanylyltransferase [Trueperaceae bacterium]
MTHTSGAAPRAWHGVILAGGRSRRFGTDKTFARVGGRRLIDAAVASLRDADGISVLLGAPERVAAVAQRLPAGCVPVADDLPGHGPMGGLATALARRPDGWVAVLAVDVPLVPRAWWGWLAAQYREGTQAIVPRDGLGRWEPLAALYHGSLASGLATELAAARAGGEPRGFALHPWLDALTAAGRLVVADPEEMPEDALLNVNRPEDAAAIERSIATAKQGGPTDPTEPRD